VKNFIWSSLVYSLLLILMSIIPGHAFNANESSVQGMVRKVPSPELSNGTVNRRHKSDELIVKFKQGVVDNRKTQLHKKLGSVKSKEFASLRIHHLKLKKGLTVEEAVELYKGDPDVEYAEPNYQYQALLTPNDPQYSRLWGMTKINASAAWNSTTGNSSVVVAVIDTGIDYNHADLAANVWTNPGEIAGNGLDDDANGYLNDLHGIDTANTDADPLDDHGHGTHVAGTIGAVGNNGTGVTGVNWNIKIIACKFLDAAGNGYTDGAIDCLNYIKGLKDRGVNIVATNNSWGGGENSQALRDAIDAQRDILFIAAAGNDYDANNDKRPSYPASYQLPNVLTVAATDSADQKPFFSNYGRRSVHIGAPGNDIYSTLPAVNSFNIPGGYGSLNGTSMATPHVTGLAALLKAQDSSRDWRSIKNLILAGGDNVSSMANRTVTGKRINAQKSLACMNNSVYSVLQVPATVTVNSPTTVTALSINCDSSAGPVTASTASGSTFQLYDDGVLPDIVAGDGIFTGSWTPSRAQERLTFSFPTGTESIAVPPLTINRYLPTGSTQAFYSHFIDAQGGMPPYSWVLTASQSLPPGLTLHAETGEISGTPTTTGTYTFTVQMTDSLGSTQTMALSIQTDEAFVTEKWAKFWDSGDIDYLYGMTTDRSGNVFVTGTSYDTAIAAFSVVTIKYDPSGELQWKRSFRKSSDASFGIAADTQDNIYVVGRSDWHLQILKYDQAGNLLMTKTDSSTYSSSWALAIDAGDNLYVVGQRATDYSHVLLKYNATGTLLWERPFLGWSNGRLSRAAVDSSNNIYITGSYSNGTTTDAITVKYDPAGNQLWARTYDRGSYDSGDGIAVDNDSNIYVGATSSATNNDYAVIKYDSSGTQLWARVYDSGFPEEVEGVAVDTAGNAFVTGSAYAAKSQDFITVKFDQSGNLQWAKPFGARLEGYGYYGETSEVAWALAVDGTGNIYAAGWSDNGTDYDFVTVKYGEIAQHALAYSKLGSGSGTVLFTPGTSCTDNCTNYFGSGTQVTLTASPDANSLFSGWGGACSGMEPCIVTVDEDKQVTATFTQKPALSYSRLGNGGGNVNFSPGTSCTNNCNQYFDSGTQVTLTASPDANSIFSGWGGACSGMEPCIVTVDADKQVTATFTQKPALSYSRLGNGSGSVTFSPGTSCTNNCAQYFDSGTQVTLTASPDANSVFSGWGGACSGTESCMVTMDSDLQVTATFTQKPALNYSPLGYGGGSVTFSPGTSCTNNCTQYFDSGTQVTLNASPDANSVFSGWGGACSGTEACIVNLNSDTTVTARFDSTSGSITAKAMIAAGQDHSVALRSDGTVWTWGSNSYGQLGDGTTINRTAPTQVPLLTDVTKVATGSSHTLVLKGDGTVWTWGDNSSGQLGDGTTTRRLSPVKVQGLSGITELAAGTVHSLAVKSDGTVWTWGNNSYGQLGDGTTTPKLTPVMAANLADMNTVAGGFYFSAALKKDGTVWTWGIGSLGQLGDGMTAQHNSPIQVPGVGGVVNLTTGWNYIMAVTNSGTIRTWGGNYYGQLGDGTLTQRSTPITVPGIVSAATATARGTTSINLQQDGSVWAWGKNDYGQLGDGTTTQRLVPTRTLLLADVAAVAAGFTHSIALKTDGTVWSWGYNASGQLGDGTTINHSSPAKLDGINLDVTAPTTTATPPGGTYGYAQIVTLSANETTATTFYTLDGSTPSTSSAVYGGPLTIQATTTLKFFARDAAGNMESVQTHDYAIVPVLPTADFSSSVTTGFAPLAVSFTDLSTGYPTSWSWDFGDTITSTLQNPVHSYLNPGTYTVSLMASNGAGSNTITKSDTIVVSSCPSPSLITPVYEVALNGELIRLRAGDIDENLDLNRDITIIISGGYDCGYLTQGGTTNIHGTVTVSSGTATLENLVIQ